MTRPRVTGGRKTSQRAREGLTPPPLTSCPVCGPPKSTSEASRPSKRRPRGRLAPARATTVGKMSSTLQQEGQDGRGFSWSQTPWPRCAQDPAGAARTQRRQPPIGPTPSARLSCLLLPPAPTRGRRAWWFSSQVLPGLKSQGCHGPSSQVLQFSGLCTGHSNNSVPLTEWGPWMRHAGEAHRSSWHPGSAPWVLVL